MRRVLTLLVLLCCAVLARAGEAQNVASDVALEARVNALAAELRCLVCQNQTIADSHADLAQDLRQQVREMLQKGQSDAQIIDYMTQRYGDFVLYRPPVKSTTALLWYGPALLMLGGLGVLHHHVMADGEVGHRVVTHVLAEARGAPTAVGHLARDRQVVVHPGDAGA